MNKSIFIVEDDEAIRESLIQLLELEGFKVDSAINGLDGINQLHSCTQLPDLILLDLMMPVMDGFQFCDEKKIHERLSQIPILIMSADGLIREKQARTKAADYIKKPLDIDDLIERICKIINIDKIPVPST